jgi:hypothetical protein
VRHRGDDYRFDLVYHADRFERPAMNELLRQLSAVLDGAANDPSRDIMAYELAEPSSATPVVVEPAEHLLTGPQLRALSELPPMTCVYLDNRGDLIAQDIVHLRRIAPGIRVVAVYRPAGVAYEVPENWSPSTAPLRVPIGVGPITAAVGEVTSLRTDNDTVEFVRRRPDGVLEFAGPVASGQAAADPLEAIAVMRDAADVRDAVIVDDVAYVVGRVDVLRLRQRMITQLPAYLIPRQIVPLDRLPLTPAYDYDLAALRRLPLA